MKGCQFKDFMTLHELKELFRDDNPLSNNKCSKLSENYELALDLEKQKVSQFSSGVVEGEESLVRQIFSPIHYDSEEKEFTAMAFKDAQDKGLSVNRINKTSVSSIHKAGKSIVKRVIKRDPESDRVYVGFVSANCSAIRALRPGLDATQAFGVYDSSLEHDHSHSDVCMIKLGNSGDEGRKSLQKMRRRELQKAFTASHIVDNEVDLLDKFFGWVAQLARKFSLVKNQKVT